MPDTFEDIFARWSIDRGYSQADMLIRLGGTVGYREARDRCRGGASEQVTRILLDQTRMDTMVSKKRAP